MHLELLREIPNDSGLRAEWNALVQETDQPQVFFTWEWARAVDLAYHELLRPWLILARDAGQLVGLVALALDSQNRAVFLDTTTADYCDFVTRYDRRSEFVDAAFGQLQQSGVHELSLANLPADSPSVPALEAAAARLGFALFSRTAYECARVNLGSPEERAQLKLKLSKKKTFRRSMHTLARDGSVQVSHLTQWEDVEPILPEFANAHVARFLATDRVSNLARADRRLFLHELARLLCESGSLTLSRLLVGEHAIAWHYGFRFHGSWFWYQPTFESRLEVHSPGRLLLANMLMEACDIPTVETFDLGLGAEGYKERVANAARATLHIAISRSPVRIAREKVRFRAAERIKQSPGLEASIRGTLTRVKSAREELRKHGAGRFAARLSSRAARSLAGREEVRFYQWEGGSTTNFGPNAHLKFEPIDLHVLATAVMAYESDADTTAYLLRSAQRVTAGKDSGVALVDAGGTPVHFSWVSPFDGFSIAELQTTLSAPSPDAHLIFDCWTPPALRNQGLYKTAIAMLAHQLALSGHAPWIFSAATNQSSARGIERAGFQFRYSMISRKTPLGRTITVEPASSVATQKLPIP